MTDLTRGKIEAVAQRAADALLSGHRELAEPLSLLIEALDALDADPDLEDSGDLEDGCDAESLTWGGGALDQVRFTYEIGPDGRVPPQPLPADVPGFEQKCGALPGFDQQRTARLARWLEAGGGATALFKKIAWGSGEAAY